MPHALIPSDRVEGTAIYDRNGKHVGKIERLMIDKITGQVQYGVVTFGGFLGFGEHYFPIPWDALKYHAPTDPPLAGTLVVDGGYVLGVTEKQLEKAPFLRAERRL